MDVLCPAPAHDKSAGIILSYKMLWWTVYLWIDLMVLDFSFLVSVEISASSVSYFAGIMNKAKW